MQSSYRVALLATVLCAVHPATLAGEPDPGALSDEQAAATAQAGSYSYTWEELVELIPDIKEMRVVRSDRRRVARADQIDDTVKLCKKEKAPNSLIARRKCYTLDEYVEQHVEARRYFSEMMSGNMTRGHLGEGGGATMTGRTGFP